MCARRWNSASFPSMLLATTLARLVLNVATTRLILTHAGTRRDAGGRARGDQAFGEFVAGDQLVVGIIIFVDHRGDSVRGDHQRRHAHQRSGGPVCLGRHAGQADGDRCRSECRHHRRSAKPSDARRKSRSRPTSYGAMDGASKFVRGDAIAGIIITLINIVGGFIIGMAEHGMSLGEAAKIFTHADDRRRPGQPGAGVFDFAGGRLARDA